MLTFAIWVDMDGVLTEETLAEAILHLWNTPPLEPCGSKRRPHLTAPAPIGKITRCVQCGDLLVYVTKNRGRDARLEDFPAGTTLEDAVAISAIAKGFGS